MPWYSEWWSKGARAFARWRQRHLPAHEVIWPRIIDLVIAAGIIFLGGRCFLPNLQNWLGQNPSSFADKTSPIGYQVCAVLLALAVSALWRTYRSYRRSLGVFLRVVEQSKFIAPCLLVLALAAFSIWLAVPGKWTASVGTLFPIAVAFVTLGGFFFTLNKLDDILSRIHSYGDLLEHLGRMINREIDRAKDAHITGPGQIVIVANAVSFGNISSFERYPAIHRLLITAFAHADINVRVLCRDWEWWIPNDLKQDQKQGINHQPSGLTQKTISEIEETSLGRFYWAWQNSPGWTAEKLRRPYYQAISLLDALRTANPNSSANVTKVVWTFPDTYAPFHMVLTTDRALLFHVLDFPIQNDGQPSRIQVIGSEVSDAATVQQLLRSFKHHARQRGVPKIQKSGIEGYTYDLANDPVLND